MEKEKLKDVLSDVRAEAKRFLIKLDDAEKRLSKSDNKEWGVSTKEAASVRRAALDLKNELTRITQSVSY